VVGFSILLTESFLISSSDRKPKSTLPMAEGTGCEMFIVACIKRQRTSTAVDALNGENLKMEVDKFWGTFFD
jgi:hypothetical protein